MVLALPRGGVPVASEVARALDAPLDVFVVRTLGVPGHEEIALGAIATGGTRVLNTRVIESLDIPAEWLEAIDAKERRELERRERAYREGRPPPELTGRTVILVDDGLATGYDGLVERAAACRLVLVGAASHGTHEFYCERAEITKRFWMWRNTVVAEFVQWLRDWNDGLPEGAEKVGFHGVHLYSLHRSMEAVVEYLDGVDPEAARVRPRALRLL